MSRRQSFAILHLHHLRHRILHPVSSSGFRDIHRCDRNSSSTHWLKLSPFPNQSWTFSPQVWLHPQGIRIWCSGTFQKESLHKAWSGNLEFYESRCLGYLHFLKGVQIKDINSNSFQYETFVFIICALDETGTDSGGETPPSAAATYYASVCNVGRAVAGIQ